MFLAAVVPGAKIDVADLCILTVVQRAVEEPIGPRGDVATSAIAGLSEGEIGDASPLAGLNQTQSYAA